MLRKGNDTCPVESCIRFQPRCAYEKTLTGMEGTNTFPTSGRFNP